MLLVDRLELPRRFRRLAGVQVCEALVVEHVRRIGLGRELGDVDIRIVLAGRDQTGAGDSRKNDRGDAR